MLQVQSGGGGGLTTAMTGSQQQRQRGNGSGEELTAAAVANAMTERRVEGKSLPLPCYSFVYPLFSSTILLYVFSLCN